MRRYFRINSGTYEDFRSQLDAANGYPSSAAHTTIPAASMMPRDANGMILLALKSSISSRPTIGAVLAGMLAGSAMDEISEEEYSASMPHPEPLP